LGAMAVLRALGQGVSALFRLRLNPALLHRGSRTCYLLEVSTVCWF
jgi:hypothetical protein